MAGKHESGAAIWSGILCIVIVIVLCIVPWEVEEKSPSSDDRIQFDAGDWYLNQSLNLTDDSIDSSMVIHKFHRIEGDSVKLEVDTMWIVKIDGGIKVVR
jgi:hypothetical protein